MEATEVLKAFAEEPKLADDVLLYLNHGMWDEWDCDLLTGITEVGFGGPELQIAARSGLSLAEYHKEHPDVQTQS